LVFEKIHKLSWPEFYKGTGFKWEKLDSLPTPDGIDSLYTCRVTDSIRRLPIGKATI
jgi:hypothetical protein